MSKQDFVKNLIFHVFKDKEYSDTRILKTIFKELLGCEYEDQIVNDCFVKIVNYQIEKYGHNLYTTTATIRRR